MHLPCLSTSALMLSQSLEMATPLLSPPFISFAIFYHHMKPVLILSILVKRSLVTFAATNLEKL